MCSASKALQRRIKTVTFLRRKQHAVDYARQGLYVQNTQAQSSKSLLNWVTRLVMSKEAPALEAEVSTTEKAEKRPFVAPKLRCHEDLPEITGVTFV